MRLPEPRGFELINRYLLPHEHAVIRLRQHTAFLISPLAAALGTVLGAIAVSAVGEGGKAPVIIVWLLAAFLVIRFALTAYTWSIQYIVITRNRLLLISGLGRRTVKMLPLPKLAEMTFDRSFGGRVMGYGTFIIESAGQTQLTIGYIVYSEQLYLEISAMLFHEADEPEEPEGLDQDDDPD